MTPTELLPADTPALGLGDDVRVTGAEIAAALIVDGRAVHIGAFAGRGADLRVS